MSDTAHHPKIFISHAWEDKPLVRRLQAGLSTAGARVWVDHVGIRSGDNLPERISKALEWCDVLLLVWSKASSQSVWVEDEWTNAYALRKSIIPCRVDNTPLPAILANKVYLEFHDFDRGLAQLLRDLQLDRLTTSPAEQPASPQTAESIRETPPARVEDFRVTLRSLSLKELAAEEVKQMLKEKDFFDLAWNPQGQGLQHAYSLIEHLQGIFVSDRTTGLVWQPAGSPKPFTFAEAGKYLRRLNEVNFAGYHDWRLPTLEEAMSLMEPQRENVDLYISSVFAPTQAWIWTADRESAGVAWLVSFKQGGCGFGDMQGKTYVRAVCRVQ